MRNFEITKREVLASISIIAVMMLVGIFISAKITERQMDRNEVYNKAVKIESQEMFSYGMRTNVGNAFVYGTLEALDPVSYPEIDGSYMYVEKIKKRYTMHTRTVAHTDANGNTTYTIETYWSWDYAGEESKASSTVSFCEATFPISKFELPGMRSTPYTKCLKGPVPPSLWLPIRWPSTFSCSLLRWVRKFLFPSR